MKSVTDYRYEKKYLVKISSISEILSLLKLHPAAYNTHYPHRYVNSVYFDSPGMRNYHSHTSGEPIRKKVRIRWYGEESGLIENPVMEMKEKKGGVGKKRSFLLPQINVGKNRTDWCGIIKKTLLPADIKEEIRNLSPVLFTRYCRHYYISGDKRCRLTVDSDICFGKISPANFRTQPERYFNTAVIELKYSTDCDCLDYEAGTLFNSRITAYSKYLEGISCTAFL